MREEVKHEEGLAVARRYAGWHIGDQGWADQIVNAYLNPEIASADMDADGVPKQTGLIHRWE